MSGLELLGLAALASAYVDSRYQISKDFRTVREAAAAQIDLMMSQRRRQLNLFFMFERSVNAYPNNMCLVYPRPRFGSRFKVKDGVPLDSLFEVREFTYREAYDHVLRYSSVLYHDHNVRPGDIIALDFVNSDEYVFMWLALWNLGVAPVLLNYNLQGKALEHCIRVSASVQVFHDEETANIVAQLAPELNKDGIKTVALDDHFRAAAERTTRFRLPDDQRPIPKLWDPACYIFTSGTTGLPKAAPMSWKKANNSRLYAGITGMGPKDVLYSAMPLYHTTAAVLGFFAIISRGGALAVGHRFSVSTFWTQARLCKATVIQYVGETCRYLLNAPPSPDEKRHRVRMALGNGLRPDVWRRFKERFNIGVVDEFYGATELPTVCTNHQQGDFGVGSCGAYGSLVSQLMFRTRYTLAAVDPETLEIWRDPVTGWGRHTRDDEPGEFLFKLDAKNLKVEYQGYHGNSKATDEKIILNLFRKGDAWVRTGDLLKRNKDNMIFFIDRMGDTFRWKSENVSTNEVEEAISELSDVQQAVVVGLGVPNHEGRAGFAIIQPADVEAGVDMVMLSEHLLKRLPLYAVPIFLKITKRIATTGNNKVQKAAFRNQKLPGEPEEKIYWLHERRYQELTKESWDLLVSGKVKL